MKTFYFAKRKLQLVPAAITLIALAISTSICAQTITTLDAPGAGTGPNQGTYAMNINASGTIIGFSRGANNIRHGFIRSRDGSFTIFDAPGAGTAPGQGTRAYSVNASGAITGFFTDSVNTAHGYVRSSEGVITVSMRREQGRGRLKVPFLITAPNSSTRTARSRDTPLTLQACFTVSYAIRMALSPRSMPQVQAR